MEKEIITAETLEKELQRAEEKLKKSEALIKKVQEELDAPWLREYEEEGNCCEDAYEGDFDDHDRH